MLGLLLIVIVLVLVFGNLSFHLAGLAALLFNIALVIGLIYLIVELYRGIRGNRL